MKTFLKFILTLLIWTLIGCVIIGGALLADLPLENAVAVLIGLMVLWYGFKLIRFLWRRHQARERVEQLINVAPDARGLSVGVWRLWKRRSEKDERFLQVLKFLHSSSLRSHGEPVYVLPWQLLLGDTDSEKSTLLQSIRLSRPTLDHPLLDGHGQDIHWHLYNRGIVLDTPAVYANAAVSGSHEDWLRLLMLLEKYRRDEPVNGVIIAVSVTSLLQAGSDALLEMAAKYRRLLEDMVQILGVKVPVNLLLTQADKLPGFSDWASALPTAQTLEPLGAAFEGDTTPEAFAQSLMTRIAARIRELNLLALRDQNATPDMLRLPARIQALDRSLSLFVGTLFEGNHFQETQSLRGIYLCAQGNVKDEVLSNDESPAPAAQSLFLFDVFTHILPAQRIEIEAVTVASEARLRKRRTQAIGWSAAIAVVTVAMGTLYTNDKTSIKEAGRIYSRQLSVAVDLDSRVSNLLAYHDLIMTLENRRFFPWLAPGAEPAFVAKMKEDLANRVAVQLVEEVDQLFSERLEHTFFADKGLLANKTADISKAAEYAGLLVRRINILTAYLEGDGEAALTALPQPFDTDTFANNDPESLAPLNQLYIRSLVWARETHPDTHKDAVISQQEQLRGKLDKVLSHAGADLTWMIAWANSSPRLKTYKISEFWRAGSGAVKEEVMIPRAFTTAGKAQIDAFIEELKHASGNKSLLTDALPRFNTYYRSQYLKAWENFALHFGEGLSALRTREEWLSVINNLTHGRNIYFNVLNLIDTELAPYRDGDEIPDWLALNNYYQDMRAIGPTDGTNNSKRNKVLTNLALKTIGKAGPLGKMVATSGASALKTKAKVDKASAGPTPDERAAVIEQAAEFLLAYQTAMNEFVYNAEVRSSAYAATSALFNDPENPAKGGTPYAAAFDSVQKLQAMVGKQNAANAAFWALYKAPLDLLRGYMLQEASCQFDDMWRDSVLAELEGVPDYKRDEYLRGEAGILWTFLTTTAQPFMRQEFGKGFSVRRAQGNSLAVQRDFLTFVARAKDTRKSSASLNVEIHAFPASLNVDARTAIRKSTLTVSCPEGSYDLHNYNYPASRRFPWSLACTGVTLDINLSSLTLQKTWKGATALPDFIREFGGGPKAFTVDDFPMHVRQLRELGVTEVLMQFDIDGAGQVLQSVATTPLNIPQHAAACWAP